jgi:hypothetical protein
MRPPVALAHCRFKDRLTIEKRHKKERTSTILSQVGALELVGRANQFRCAQAALDSTQADIIAVVRVGNTCANRCLHLDPTLVSASFVQLALKPSVRSAIESRV